MNHECQYCAAYHFIDETSGLAQQEEFEICCKKGDVTLQPLKAPPSYLRSLYQDQDPRGREFRQNIRRYNSALAFTSLNYNKDTRVSLNHGIQTFRIHGDLYHLQGPLEPGSHEPPVFAQLFFYDPEFAANARARQHPECNREILSQLALELQGCNPYISIYKSALERLRADAVANLEPLRLILSPQMRLIMEKGADRRRENLPTSNELAVIIPDEFDQDSRRDIILALRDPVDADGRRRPQLTRIDVTHAAYMPLHYVLLFPNGDYGWHYALTLRDHQNRRKESSTRLQQRQFYRYRLHVRKDEFSVLFYACRLFQQYVVDAFAACETTKLT